MTESSASAPKGAGRRAGSTPAPSSFSKSTWPIVEVRIPLKHCVECGKLSPYVSTDESETYSFRVCWGHLSPEERAILAMDFYGD